MFVIQYYKSVIEIYKQSVLLLLDDAPYYDFVKYI